MLRERLAGVLGRFGRRTGGRADRDPGNGAEDLAAHAARSLAAALATTDRDALDRTVVLLREALAAIPAAHPDRAGALANLGAALQARYERGGGLADLVEAIDAGEAALGASPADDPDRPGILSNLGNALRLRYECGGGPALLDRAVEVGAAAVAATSPDDPDRAGVLSNLGNALQARYELGRAAADLDRAVEVGGAAVEATPANSPDRPAYLSNLGNALQARYGTRRAPADLDRAVEVDEEAVAAAPVDSPDRAGYLSNLGNALQARYERRGHLPDLNRAIAMHEEAVAATPVDSPDRAGYLSNLGGALQARHERKGELADLNRAIDVGEDAVAAAAADGPDRAGYLSTLGNALRTRYERLSGTVDLDRAIGIGEAAVAATPLDGTHRARHLSNLGNALRIRYERLGELTGVDRAVALGEATIAAGPADDPDRAVYLSNLGLSLQARYDRLETAADLDRAIEVGEEAVAATAHDSPDRAAYLSNLGIALQRRFGHAGAAIDLERALEICSAAVSAIPAEHPDRALYGTNLGLALESQFRRTGRKVDLHRAVAAFRTVVAVRTAPASVRALAAREWGAVAVAGRDWPQAVAGYAAAIGLLARVATRGLERSDQEYWLAELAGLGVQAAACCLEAGQPDRAAQLWEQGRGVLFGQALDTRTDVTRLTERHPQLAAAFIRLRDELNAVPGAGRSGGAVGRSSGSLLPAATAAGTDSAAVGREIDRRRALAEEFDRLIARIRRKRGFARFLLPLPVGELLAAAADGPVVLLNVTAIRSDALLLTPAGVRSVHLPGLRPQVVHEKVTEFLAAPSQSPDRIEAVLNDVLGWLWDTIASPVLRALDLTGSADKRARPRLWWVPSGLLAFLPLHAAGHHASRGDPVPATVLDRVVSSYTPTVRALVHARRHDPSGRSKKGVPAQVLAVTMPHTPGEPDLPGTLGEAALLLKRFPDRVRLLHGELRADEAGRLGLPSTGPAPADALHDEVMRALPLCRWAHFACHATNDLTDPSAGSLLLCDHPTRPLTVLDLTRLRLDDAELAFLSACATARTGPRLADEAIQLAAAMQLVGYRHVVALLWPIADRPAVRIAGDIYAVLAARGAASTAEAVHEAVLRCRERTPDRPSAWAAHIHSGA